MVGGWRRTGATRPAGQDGTGLSVYVGVGDWEVEGVRTLFGREYWSEMDRLTDG